MVEDHIVNDLIFKESLLDYKNGNALVALLLNLLLHRANCQKRISTKVHRFNASQHN
jgi:hypothetical protein